MSSFAAMDDQVVFDGLMVILHLLSEAEYSEGVALDLADEAKALMKICA
jgi:hypothetical protein